MRTFSAHETEWLRQLDGIELASFWRRALALVIDAALIVVTLLAVIALGVYSYATVLEHHGEPIHSISASLDSSHFIIKSDNADFNRHVDEEPVRLVTEILVPVLYFGILTWLLKGRSPGKLLTRIRVVSIVHPHLTFWHSVERALGYGAAALEFGFGFVQFFIHPYRRCAQDRLAETIVVTERSFGAMRPTFAPHAAAGTPLEPEPTSPQPSAGA
jgi:uncharacterized RDD family membrane protein YckC